MAYQKSGLLIERINSTATSGGTLNLANNSQTYQQLTGTTSHTVVLPQANASSPNECPVSLEFVVMNRSTGAVTVNYFGGSLAKTIPANSQATFRLVDNSTSAGSWDVTNDVSSSSIASLSSLEKLGALAALGNELYQDSETSTAQIKVNPEEIGGDYWTTRPNLITARTLHIASDLNGYGYVASGSPSLVSTERFDLDSNYFLGRAATAVVHDDLGTTFNLNGFSYLVGGSTTNTIEKYTDSTNVYSSVAALPASRTELAGFSVGGFGYAGAGFSGGSNDPSFYLYSDTANAWYQRSNYPVAVRGLVSFTDSGIGYFSKGYLASGNTDLATTYAYDSTSNSWRLRSPSTGGNAGRYLTAGSNVPGGGMVVAGIATTDGGSNGGAVDVATTEIYTPASDIWKVASPIAAATRAKVSFTLSGELVSTGGSVGGVVNTVQSYKSFSFFQVPITKKVANIPASVFVAAALSSVTASVPVRLRTDGDTWKYFESNKDSVLKGSGSGAAEGAELVTNGTFNTDLSGWTSNNLGGSTNTWQSPGYALLSRSNNQQTIYQLLTTVTGKQYRLQFNVSNVTGGGGLYVEAQNGVTQFPGGSPNIASLTGITADGTYYIEFVAQSTNTIINFHMEVAAVCSCRLDNVSVKAIASAGIEAISAKFQPSPQIYFAGGTSNRLASGAVTTTEIFNVNSGSWSTRQAMPAARYGQCGFSYAGVGYAVGGFDTSDTPTATNYAYDEITNTYATKTAYPTTTQYGPGNSLNGFGYIPASTITSGNATTQFQQFNPTANSWSSKNPQSQDIFQGCLLNASGFLWNAGGRIGAVTGQNYNSRYSADTNSWVSKTVLGTGVNLHAGFTTQNKNYVVGGMNTAQNAISTTQIYDTATDAWSNAAGSTSTAVMFCTGVFSQGYGWVEGGVTGSGTNFAFFSQFNPVTGTWSDKTNQGNRIVTAANFSAGEYYNYELQVGLPTYLAALGAFQIVARANSNSNHSNGQASGHADGKTYIWDTPSGGNGNSEFYTHETNAWTNWTVVPVNLFNGGCGQFILGIPYICNGPNTITYSVDLENRTYVNKGVAPALPRFRVLQGASNPLNGYGYFFGGDFNNSGTLLNSIDQYSPSSNTWTTKATSNYNAPRYSAGFEFGGFIYQFGGNDTSGFSSNTDRYNDASNSWTLRANYPFAVTGTSVSTVNGYPLTVGGWTGSIVSNVYRYSDTLNTYTAMPNFMGGVGRENMMRDNVTGLIHNGDAGVSADNLVWKIIPAIKNITLGAGLRVS